MTEHHRWTERPAAPSGLSEGARAYLGQELPYPPGDHPAREDVAGWRQWVAEHDANLREAYPAVVPEGASVTSRTINGVATWVVVPAGVDEASAAVVVEPHGGGLIMGGGDLAWRMNAARLFARSTVTWAPDYRMPPDHPYPAGLDDCTEVYRAALEEAPGGRVVVTGASAGGNLAAAMVLRAAAAGLAMPAALVLLTPELDLTESGDSFTTADGLDFMSRLLPVNEVYAAGNDLAAPLLSPLFGNLSNFPPTLLQTGTRDMFLSNTVRMHRRLMEAGVPCELHVFEAMPHGGFGGATPEDDELRETTLRFEDAHLA